jgi:hypothetical protein
VTFGSVDLRRSSLEPSTARSATQPRGDSQNGARSAPDRIRTRNFGPWTSERLRRGAVSRGRSGGSRVAHALTASTIRGIGQPWLAPAREACPDDRTGVDGGGNAMDTEAGNPPRVDRVRGSGIDNSSENQVVIGTLFTSHNPGRRAPFPVAESLSLAGDAPRWSGEGREMKNAAHREGRHAIADFADSDIDLRGLPTLGRMS